MQIEFANRMAGLKGSAIREIFKYAADPQVISLAGGNPDPVTFPNRELSRIAQEVLAHEPVLALQYGITEGYTPLREEIRSRLKRVEGVGTPEDELIVVSGGQQGIELTAKVLLNEGDAVAVEEPSFIGATNAFRSYGAKLVGIPVLSDGMDVEKLEQALKSEKIKLIYTIPTFQNPSGTSMSREKRRQVYELAYRYGTLILEDNPYGELYFSPENRMTPIKARDPYGIVIYSGSFSKILAPGMRLGYLCGPRELIQKVVIAKQISDVHTAMPVQLLAYRYMKKFDLDGAVAAMRAHYAHKCGVMQQAIREEFPAGVETTQPGGGLFIWCDLKNGTDTLQLAKKAIEKKVCFVPGNTFMVDMDRPCSALRLNYSTVSDEKIREGIHRLSEVISENL